MKRYMKAVNFHVCMIWKDHAIANQVVLLSIAAMRISLASRDAITLGRELTAAIRLYINNNDK